MTDLPYTDADLRTEAALCLSALSIFPNVGDITRHLPDAYVESLRNAERIRNTWGDLLDNAGITKAARAINDLVAGAAEVSEWAVNLGAAQLTPQPTMGWYCTTSGWDLAVQIATSDDLTDTKRAELLAEIQTAVGGVVQRVLGLKPVATRDFS